MQTPEAFGDPTCKLPKPSGILHANSRSLRGSYMQTPEAFADPTCELPKTSGILHATEVVQAERETTITFESFPRQRRCASPCAASAL